VSPSGRRRRSSGRPSSNPYTSDIADSDDF
jgi:hypothetical protein